VLSGPLVVLIRRRRVHREDAGVPGWFPGRKGEQTARHITPILRPDIDECWNSGVEEQKKRDDRPGFPPITGRSFYDEAHSCRLHFALDGPFPLGCYP
jgi:hypothetical protein